MKQEVTIQLSQQQLKALENGDTLTIIISSDDTSVKQTEEQPIVKEKGGSFFMFFQSQSDWLRQNGKIRTSETYRATFRKFRAFSSWSWGQAPGYGCLFSCLFLAFLKYNPYLCTCNSFVSLQT